MKPITLHVLRIYEIDLHVLISDGYIENTVTIRAELTPGEEVRKTINVMESIEINDELDLNQPCRIEYTPDKWVKIEQL